MNYNPTKSLLLSALALALCASGCSHATRTVQSSPTTAGDIGHLAPGVSLGSGWYPLEQFHGLTFRWVNNDAEVTICPDLSSRTLAMTVEPGPGVGSRPFTLRVIGNGGDTTTTLVRGLQEVKVPISSSVPAETLLLRADSKNLRTPNDKRILNFRVLNIALDSTGGSCRKEIVKDGSPLEVGPHWYGYETFNGESFRWANNDVQVKLTKAQSKPFTLEASVEPGPGLAGAPLVLKAKNNRGAQLAQSEPLKARGYAELRLPASPAGTVFTLSVQSRNAKTPHDPRILNFRVFDIKVKPQV